MKTYIALFRGINVGGNNMLPMKELKRVLEKDGCQDVRTYIQSGNVILTSSITDPAKLARRLSAAILKSHGFEPRVMVLSADELQRAASGNPFAAAVDNPAALHLFFLEASPRSPDLKALEALKTKTEAFALQGAVFYLHTPDGLGRSKLATRIERSLGVQGTARNWRTVTTLLSMLSQSAD